MLIEQSIVYIQTVDMEASIAQLKARLLEKLPDAFAAALPSVLDSMDLEKEIQEFQASGDDTINVVVPLQIGG